MTTNAHLFFSYAHSDEKVMIPLHARMQAATGHNLWIDKVGLTRGIEWEESIHRAIEGSYGVLFAITSAFAGAERIFIRDREIPWTIDRFRKTQGPVIFPILFDKVELPPQLTAALDDKDLKYLFHMIDFTDRDEARLFDELKGLLPEASAGNHPFIIDWPRLPTFQGRDDLLVELHGKLKGGAVGIKTAGVHGMGGIGKTQLAVEYAHRYRFHYPAGVYWVNAARADWTSEIADIADRLGLQPPDNAESGKREQQLAAAFERHLKNLGGDALVILDNVENPADVPNRVIGPKLRFTDLPARLLITTRRQDLPAGFAALPVNLLPPADARALLLKARPEAAPDPAIDSICKALGYLPLALGLTAAALKKRPTMKPAAFLDHLREKGVDAIARALQISSGELGAREDYVIVLDAALDWHWKLIGYDAKGIIALTAAFGEAAEVPIARLKILQALREDPDALEQPFSDAMKELRAANLIESVGEATIRLHPLVRDYVCRAIPEYQQWLWEGAWLMAHAYRTPQTLYEETLARGFKAIVTDLYETVVRMPSGGMSVNPAQQLARLFDWEGHHLTDENVGLNPAYLIQHVRERAHHQSDLILRDDCDKWLVSHLHFRTADAYRFPHDPALIRIIEGHEGAVSAVSVLVDGKQALSASYDNTLRLWDLQSGAEIRRFEGHTSAVSAVSVLVDGRQVLSASSDSTLRLWDIASGVEIRRFEGHTSYVNAVAILPGGKQALSASVDKTLRLWDLQSGAEIRRFEGHISFVTAVSVVGDGKQALSTSYDKTLRLWDIASGAEIRRFEGHTSYVSAVAILLDGKQALSASHDKTLRLWDIASGAEIRRFEGHDGAVSAVSVLGDGKQALSASHDKTLRLWDIASGAEIRCFEGHTNWVNAVSVVGDGKQALSASVDKTLRLWDLQSGAAVRRFEGHDGAVSAVAILGDGKQVLSASVDKTLRLWDVASGAAVRRLEGHGGAVSAVAILRDGKEALSASSDRTLRLWDLQSGVEMRRLEGHPGGVNAVAILGDGKQALSASHDKTLRLWDLQSGVEMRRLEGHPGGVNAVAILGDGKQALSASHDKTLRLWDLQSGVEMRRLEGHSGAVRAVSILPDGKQALSASDDRTLRLWDIASGAEIRRFEGHTSYVNAMSVVRDGKQALSASDDRTLRLWDVASGACLAVLRLEEIVTCLAVLPPVGALPSSVVSIFVGSESGKVRLIRLHVP